MTHQYEPIIRFFFDGKIGRFILVCAYCGGGEHA